jgi:murein DD-endopeptidase MepM/ murein hydrolase activator NlpD
MKLLPPAPGASLAKISNPSTSYSSPLSDGLLKVKTKVISIDKVLKDRKKTKKEKEKAKIKKQEKEKRSLKEDKLENPIKKETAKKKSIKIPGSSFLEKIKNFIGSIILGYFAIRLIDHAPKLLGFVEVAAKATEFIIDFGGKIFDGLVTLLDKSYEMYDGLKKNVGELFGEDGKKKFEEVSGLVKTLLNGALIAAMVGIRSGGLGRGRGAGQVVRRGFDSTGRRVSVSAQRKYFEKFGRKKFIERFGKENLKNLPRAAQRSGLTKLARRGITATLGRKGTRQLLRLTKSFISPVVKRIPFVGAFLDFALNYFVFGESLVGAFLGGAGGDLLGGLIYDMLFKGKKPLIKLGPDAPSGTSSGTDDADGSGTVLPKGSTTGRMISGYPITSPYGYRTHPVTGERGKLHGGIDIGTPTGTAVSLAEDGTIVAAGNFGGYGYMIDAWLPKTGIQLRLAHLSQIIKSSGNFKANQILGKTGGAAGSPGSGSSTGPHLHFEADRQKGAGRYGGSGDPSSFANLLRLGSTQSVSSGQGGAISSYASYDDMFMPEMILIPQIINRNVMPEGRRSESKLMATVLSGGSSSPADVLYKGA